MRVSKKSIAHLLPAQPIPAILPAGTVLFDGFIPGSPVPWKAPTVDRQGRVIKYGKRAQDYSRYTSWKTEIGLKVAVAAGLDCYAGEVRLDAIFVLKDYPGRKIPDRSNLLKACEDALQGVLIVNDTQIWGGRTERLVGTDVVEGVYLKMWAAPSPKNFTLLRGEVWHEQ